MPLRLVPIALFLLALLALPRAESCAPAFRTGHSVRIASESALIIWDSKTPRDGKKGTEHFIRRGTFDTATPDFGFLVPTPTRPEVAEADDAIFNRLEEYTKPRIVERRVQGPPPGVRGMPMAGAAKSPPPMNKLEVVGQGRVGALDYVILFSRDKKPAPVLDWMKKNGYATRDALTDWLEPYLDKGWYLTAFKFARVDASRLGLSTQAVRMTFGADEPFYPYREPEDMRSPGNHPPRLLRLYVLADDRVAGTVGKTEPWRARTVWSDHLPGDTVRQGLLKEVKIDLPREGEWSPRLTMFEDSASPRYGIDEVYFRTSPDQSVVERIEYRDVYGMPMEAAVPEATRSLLVLGTSILAGALLVGLGGIALYFFLAGRPARD